MTDAVGICNRALSYVNVPTRIISLDDKGRAAKVCNEFYDQARRELLQVHEWNFATAMVPLAGGMPYAFMGNWMKHPLPEGLVSVDQVMDGHGNRQEFFREGNFLVLMDSVADPVAKGTLDVREGMPELFKVALQYLLATKIAVPMNAPQGILDRLADAYSRALPEAEAWDSRQSSSEIWPDYLTLSRDTYA